MDQDERRKTISHEVGASLDALSIEELTDRIALLREEIVRLEAAIAFKSKSRSAADAVFKF